MGFSLVNLQTNERDFRELLPLLDTGVYKNPFITSRLWKKLGNSFDARNWKKHLSRLRVRLFIVHNKEPTVSAIYLDEKQKIHLNISKVSQWDIADLKFLVIQTIMHEYVHAHQYYCHDEQYDKMIVKCVPDSDEEYLSSFGEVQAYAHCLCIDAFHGLSTSWDRYEKCDPRVKRVLVKQTIRWVEKYQQ